MAKQVVQERRAFVRVAGVIFGISQSCYRYEGRINSENEEIGQWLLRLTDNHRAWGFGLCFLYLRNVKGFTWNHQRVHRIYRELELNLRIKPRKHLQQVPEPPLAVPDGVNQMWSMDFMHGQLADGRSFRTGRIWRSIFALEGSQEDAPDSLWLGASTEKTYCCRFFSSFFTFFAAFFSFMVLAGSFLVVFFAS
jgi:hypothetical protein